MARGQAGRQTRSLPVLQFMVRLDSVADGLQTLYSMAASSFPTPLSRLSISGASLQPSNSRSPVSATLDSRVAAQFSPSSSTTLVSTARNIFLAPTALSWGSAVSTTSGLIPVLLLLLPKPQPRLLQTCLQPQLHLQLRDSMVVSAPALNSTTACSTSREASVRESASQLYHDIPASPTP